MAKQDKRNKRDKQDKNTLVPILSKSDTKQIGDQDKSTPIKKSFLRIVLGFFGFLMALGIKLAIVGVVILIGIGMYFNPIVQEKFSGKKWTIPAKVYARPLELFSGQKLTPNDLIMELKALGYRKQQDNSSQDVGTFSLANKNQVTLSNRGFKFYDGLEPQRQVSIMFGDNAVTGIFDKDGNQVPLMRLEPLLIGGIYPTHSEDRLLIRLEEVPSYLLQTLIAVEDRDFYDHYGVSPKSIARAVWVNFVKKGVRQGGSTLTQQLVKNFFLTNERTIKRKATEAIMALVLELHYSKDEILETYLNEVFLGQAGNRAIHGFGLASQYYFATPVSELKLHQAALLVGMVRGATYYNPRKYPERALQRRNLVLDILVEQNIIDAQTASAAKSKPLEVTERGILAQTEHPAFLDMVKRALRDDYAEQDLTEEGLSIFTSFNPILQYKAEAAIAEVGIELNKRKLAKGLESAMVVTNPENGEVLALVGGNDSRYAGFNRALDAKRLVGSLIKPAVYLTALANPEKYTLTSILEDREISVELQNGTVWIPKNYTRREHGDVFLYKALAGSYNFATTRLGLEVGVPSVIDTVKALGVDVDWPAYPAILLGSGAMTPLEVARMYQTIAAGGFNLPFKAIRHVLNMQGDLLTSYPYAVEQRVEPEYIYLLQEALQKVMREGTGRGVYNKVSAQINLAGKTGTTNEYRDSWFAGFSQNLLAVVWLGHDDNRSTGLSGATGALQVWSQFMQSAHPSSLEPLQPYNVVRIAINPDTGLASAADCPNVVMIPYIRGSEPEFGADCHNHGVMDYLEDDMKSESILDWMRSFIN